VIGVVVISLWPFAFEWPSRSKIHAAVFSSILIPETSYAETLIERTPFFLIAAILAGRWVPISVRIWKVLAILVIALGALEMLQLFSSGRHPRWHDLIMGTVFTAGGLWVGRFIRRRRSETVSGGLKLFATLSLATLTAGLYIWGLNLGSLSNWDCDYEIGLGDEVGMNRSWLGELQVATLQTRASSVDLIKEANQASPLIFDHPNRVIVGGNSSEMCDQIKAENGFVVNVVARFTHDDLTGPARILTWSESIYSQNLMLGQIGSNVHFRVATGGPYNSRATQIYTRLPDAADEPADIIAEYRRGMITLSINGEVKAATDVTTIRLNNGLTVQRTFGVLICLLATAFFAAISILHFVCKPMADTGLPS